jgi:hypothetical protein
MATVSTPNKTVRRKAYICPKAPFLRLPGIAFRNGFFFTDQAEDQAIIESDPLYGVGGPYAEKNQKLPQEPRFEAGDLS